MQSGNDALQRLQDERSDLIVTHSDTLGRIVAHQMDGAHVAS